MCFNSTKWASAQKIPAMQKVDEAFELYRCDKPTDMFGSLNASFVEQFA